MRKIVFILTLLMILTLTLSPATIAQNQFPDVTEGKHSWAMDSINFMIEKGVVKGYHDGTFKPDKNVTKAELTVMIHRLFDKYRPNLNAQGYDKIEKFDDVPKGYWAHKEITEIYSYTFNWGYAFYQNADGQRLFEPKKELTRYETAILFFPFFDYELINAIDTEDSNFMGVLEEFKDIAVKKVTNEDEFDKARAVNNTMDVDKSPIIVMIDDNGAISIYDDSSAVKAVSLVNLHSQGIITASNGYFNPDSNLTRAQAVTILHRIYNQLNEKGILSHYSSK
jgi:hypothetical protein